MKVIKQDIFTKQKIRVHHMYIVYPGPPKKIIKCNYVKFLLHITCGGQSTQL